MTFGNWDESIHRKAEQIPKRQKASEVTLVDVNREAQTAHALGSSGETYAVTLNTCTCASFKTLRPCKHIYRLATEFGLLEPLPKIDRSAAKEFKKTIPDEIQRYENLYFNGAITAEKYIAVTKALSK